MADISDDNDNVKSKIQLIILLFIDSRALGYNSNSPREAELWRNFLKSFCLTIYQKIRNTPNMSQDLDCKYSSKGVSREIMCVLQSFVESVI